MQQQSPMNNQYHDDEISLIDLAKIIVKRHWWFMGTAAFGIVLTLAAAYTQKPQPSSVGVIWEYTTLVAIGYKSPRDLIEPTISVQTQITEGYLPLARAQQPEFANMSVAVSNERDSNLLVLTTRHRPNQQTLVQSFHEQLLAPLLQRHDELINMLKDEARTSVGITAEYQLVATTLAAIAVPKPVAPEESRSIQLILALGIVLTGMLAFIVPFLVEFVARVRQSLKEEKSP